MSPDFPVSPPQLPNSASPEASPRRPIARWRWWVALFIIAMLPLLLTVVSATRGQGAEMRLPRSARGLLLYCALELAFFGALWGLSWLFSRASREELFLVWRGGWKAVLWGLLYSVLMRIGLAVLGMTVIVFASIVLAMMGVKPEVFAAYIKENSGGAAKVFVPAMTQGSPFYRLLMLTLVSFVVAGLREELWRAAVMAGVRNLSPQHLSPLARNGWALGLSSTFFGLAHMYQGVVGVALTACLGLALGTIMIRHRSIWPAVIAHGAFDATSFLLLLAVADKLPK